MFARIAKLKGARVIVAGRNPVKLKLAEEFAYADEVVDLKKYSNPEKIFREFSDEKKGLDIAIECVGMPEIWELVFSCVRPGGTVHFFGGCKSGSTVSFDTTKIHYGDIKLMSVFHHTPKYFREALKLIASGQIEVEKLITDTLPLVWFLLMKICCRHSLKQFWCLFLYQARTHEQFCLFHPTVEAY